MTEQKQGDLLYMLYLEHVKNELRKTIQPEIDRVIDKCLDEAVKSLEGTIHQQYNPADYGRTFKIIIEKKD
jgi:hypothetical protein